MILVFVKNQLATMKKRAKNFIEEQGKGGLDVKDLITITQAARLRGVTRQAIADLIERGRLSRYEIAGRPFVLRSEIEAFKDSRGWPKGRRRKDG